MSLQDKIIIYTRPVAGKDELKEYLAGKGADIISTSLIETVPSYLNHELKEAMSRLSGFDLLIFTSRNGVKYFFDLLVQLGIRSDSLNHLRIAAFGAKTSEELEKHGFTPGIISTAKSSVDFLHELLEGKISDNERILLVLGNLAGNILEDGLKCKYYTERINVYKTLESDNMPEYILNVIRKSEFDLIIFTSPSAFRSFNGIMKRNAIMTDFKIACIGETTAAEVRNSGFSPLLVSSKPDGLTFARDIENYFCSI